MREDRARFGARLLAFAALWFLVSGLLMALSLVMLGLIAYAALLAVVLMIGGRWLLEQLRVGEMLTAALVSGGRGAGRAGRRLRGLELDRRVGRGLRRLALRQQARRAGAHARSAAAGAPGRAAWLLDRALRAYANGYYRLSGWLARRRPALGTHDAVRLNELGAELRRRGEHERAAAQHRVALEIARDAGDEQAEALTLNSLALALAQSGAEAEAVRHLEYARVVLHELGDEEHEGQVIANLGLVYRRQGLSDEAEILFQEALERLPPESWAYRQVEAELRRAS
ncbi:MAG TPA: tetratricopeptide repeat protein [Gaiellaceae bacterium]|nr:tetratricopeptide repeat protein [Gaiellaceae bacterium]